MRSRSFTLMSGLVPGRQDYHGAGAAVSRVLSRIRGFQPTSTASISAGAHRRPTSHPEVPRLVVKVGTSSLVEPFGGIAGSGLAKVAREVAAVSGDGRTACVLVSSGAIAFGLAELGLAKRPCRLPALQAAAPVQDRRLRPLPGGHPGTYIGLGGDIATEEILGSDLTSTNFQASSREAPPTRVTSRRAASGQGALRRPRTGTRGRGFRATL